MLKGLIVSLFLLLSIPGMTVAAEIELRDVIDALETPFKAETKNSEQIKDCLLYTSPSPRDS